MNKIIYQGAESTIYLKNNKIIKNRLKKSYRLEYLDNKIRKQRTKKELKILEKVKEIINVPKIINFSEYEIELEYLKGEKLSEKLDKIKNAKKICKEIGRNIAKLHDNNVIHGDLTTSNMILLKNKVYFIDFGLSFESEKIEDKSTDLRLIKQAIDAKHFLKSKVFYNSILEGYKISKNYKKTLNQLKKVESRGRYKEQY